MVNFQKYSICGILLLELVIVHLTTAESGKGDKILTKGRLRKAKKSHSGHRHMKKQQKRKGLQQDAPAFVDSRFTDFRHPKSPKKLAKKKRQGKGKNLKDESCCQNGGQCVLGSFCICQKEYFGRYCEFEVNKANCGAVLHLGWLKEGCDLCYCYDGKFTCLTRVYAGCDNKTSATSRNSAKEKQIFQPKKDFRDDYPYMTSPDDDYDVDDSLYGDTNSSSDGVHSSLLGTIWSILLAMLTTISH